MKNKHCDTVSFRLCGELSEGLAQIIETKGGSKSYHLRKAIQNYVSDNSDNLKKKYEERDLMLKKLGEIEISIKREEKSFLEVGKEKVVLQDIFNKFDQIKPEIQNRLKFEKLPDLLHNRVFINHYTTKYGFSEKDFTDFLKHNFS